MNKDLAKLAKRIRTEPADLEQVVSRCEEALKRSRSSADDLYLDSVALNLQGFYFGVEHLLQLIATTIDGNLPQGAEWHKELLEQLSQEMPGIRPAILSENSKILLDSYRSIRHVVRFTYTFRREPNRLEELTEKLRPTFSIVRRELDAFADLVRQRAQEN
ncbi:MAG: hypothetical protein HY868_25950 [Chloroflexi bacterium]|nr:hypothetical protein [Chloroflexota bacterium]